MSFNLWQIYLCINLKFALLESISVSWAAQLPQPRSRHWLSTAAAGHSPTSCPQNLKCSLRLCWVFVCVNKFLAHFHSRAITTAGAAAAGGAGEAAAAVCPKVWTLRNLLMLVMYWPIGGRGAARRWPQLDDFGWDFSALIFRLAQFYGFSLKCIFDSYFSLRLNYIIVLYPQKVIYIQLKFG